MKVRNKADVITHKDNAVKLFEQYLDSLINTDESSLGKADKLSYWIENWVDYLGREESFDSRRLRKYKRGEIIKVNLGFNIGSEEGGLHYAVVIDKNNSLSDPNLRIIPLTSVKEDKDINSLPEGSIFLGNELFTSLSAKISLQKRNISEQIYKYNSDISDSKNDALATSEIKVALKKLQDEASLLDRMNREIGKMKKGSIALVKQITTISKIRIYDPKTNHDILSNIKLSNEKLDLIDKCIRTLYTK